MLASDSKRCGINPIVRRPQVYRRATAALGAWVAGVVPSSSLGS